MAHTGTLYFRTEPGDTSAELAGLYKGLANK